MSNGMGDQPLATKRESKHHIIQSQIRGLWDRSLTGFEVTAEMLADLLRDVAGEDAPPQSEQEPRGSGLRPLVVFLDKTPEELEQLMAHFDEVNNRLRSYIKDLRIMLF